MTSLADAARAYNGTRFRHRGRSKDRLDCVGLVKQVYLDRGWTLPDFLLYGREPAADGLVEKITEALGEPVLVSPVRMKDLRPDDVVVQRFDVRPHHVALLGEFNYGGTVALTMIHADGWNGRVLEHRLTPDMVARITHVYRRPV